jgi:hypothetical protein
VSWRRTLLGVIVLLPLARVMPAGAAPLSPDAAYVRNCLIAAGNAYHEPAALLVVLLNVEGGRLGAVSLNTNRTVDIGPMQVNDIWVPKVAAHWATTPRAAYLALRDNFCANVEAGAWILRMGLDEARGDVWEGVGFYHSHDPDQKRSYLAAVLKQALRLEEASRPRRAAPPAQHSAPPTTRHVLASSAPFHDSSEGY